MVKAITGQSGAVRWGYHCAATLGPWSMTSTADGGTFTAQVTQHDEFRIQQNPLVLVVPAGASQWRWWLRDVRMSGTTLTAAIDPRSE